MDEYRVTSSDKKMNKPLMEKKRRARINKSLNELKQILVESLKKSSPSHTKWEKADILEMTVQYLNCLRNQCRSGDMKGPTGIGPFVAGFYECMKLIQIYADTRPESQNGNGAHPNNTNANITVDSTTMNAHLSQYLFNYVQSNMGQAPGLQCNLQQNELQKGVQQQQQQPKGVFEIEGCSLSPIRQNPYPSPSNSSGSQDEVSSSSSAISINSSGISSDFQNFRLPLPDTPPAVGLEPPRKSPRQLTSSLQLTQTTGNSVPAHLFPGQCNSAFKRVSKELAWLKTEHSQKGQQLDPGNIVPNCPVPCLNIVPHQLSSPQYVQISPAQKHFDDKPSISLKLKSIPHKSDMTPVNAFKRCQNQLPDTTNSVGPSTNGTTAVNLRLQEECLANNVWRPW